MSNRPHVLEAAKKLNVIAETIVREGLNCHEMPIAEFFEDESNLVAQSLRIGAKASSRAWEVVPTPTVETSRPQSDGQPEVAGHGTNGSAVGGLANAATQSSAMTALAKQNVASGWIAQRSEAELPMVSTPCTRWTPGFAAPVHEMPPPASLSVPDPAVSSQRTETMPTSRPQCYTDDPGASPMSSRNQIESATSCIADRQICTLPPLQEITGQSAEGRHTLSRRGGDMHNLHPQWQPDAELGRGQETAAGSACSRPSPNANNPTLTENVMDASLSSRSCAGSTGMKALAAAAWHHDRLQDGLDPRVSELDIDSTTHIEEAPNGGPQDPAVRTSATQETNRTDHQTYGQHLSHQWPHGVTTCLQNGESLETSFWPGMEPNGSYESAPDNVLLLKNAPSYPFDQLGQADMTIGDHLASEAAYTGPIWAGMSEEEWLDTCANFSG